MAGKKWTRKGQRGEENEKVGKEGIKEERVKSLNKCCKRKKED